MPQNLPLLTTGNTATYLSTESIHHTSITLSLQHFLFETLFSTIIYRYVTISIHLMYRRYLLSIYLFTKLVYTLFIVTCVEKKSPLLLPSREIKPFQFNPSSWMIYTATNANQSKHLKTLLPVQLVIHQLTTTSVFSGKYLKTSINMLVNLHSNSRIIIIKSWRNYI